jgi:histidine triad (HIT) family protein
MISRAGSEGYVGNDFYCDVAIPDVGGLDIVYDDEWILAFHHTRPFWKTHIVVVPKRHIASLTTVDSDDAELMQRLFVVVQGIARGVEERAGAAAVLTNLGRYQDSKHLHIHVHSGGRLRG